MRAYQLYQLDAQEQIEDLTAVLRCRDDEEAIRIVEQLVDGHDVEIWDRSRLIHQVRVGASPAGALACRSLDCDSPAPAIL
jgi:hypothetical protein